jgi:hypothetical protein
MIAGRPTFPLSLALLAAILCLSSRARAQVDPWEFEVYPYATEGPGILELETDNAVVANGHHEAGEGTSSGQFRSQGSWYNQYELTYGLTDRIEAAVYLTMAQPQGRGYWYAGSKYRLRGRLFDEETLPVNLGWYLELEWHKTPQFDSSELEVELRPIIAKDFGRFSIVLNPKFEKAIFLGPDRNQGFEFGYANGIYYRWKRYLSPGLEFYGGIGHLDDSEPLREQQHYIFPVLWGSLPGDIGYSFGPGFGLTNNSDRVVVKFNLEFEKYVGALFKAGDNGWFF